MAIVAVNLTSDSFMYLSRLLDGAIVGAPSSVAINPTIRSLVDALYEVLAGGSVKVTATAPLTLEITRGVPGVVTDLVKMETDCTAEINTVNGRAGFSLVLEF